jgi:hypothetical protein
MTGSSYWLVLGPIIIVLTLLAWVALTSVVARRRQRRAPGAPVPPLRRGDVVGGVIRGGPATVSRRDEAPRHDLDSGRERESAPRAPRPVGPEGPPGP